MTFFLSQAQTDSPLSFEPVEGRADSNLLPEF